jgi:hypothetical protein
MDKEKIKKAHLKRALQMWEDPEQDTPGESFEEFFQGGYVEGVSKSAKHPSDRVILGYEKRLAKTRKKDHQQEPGLLSRVQQDAKGPYPENPEEDRHLVLQLMKFIHSEGRHGDIVKMLKTAKDSIVKAISEIAANVAAKIIFEVRKQREVTEDTEGVVVQIVLEEIWTIAKNLGMKSVSPELVKNSYHVARGIFDQMEQQLKTRQQPQPTKAIEGQDPSGVPGGMA